MALNSRLCLIQTPNHRAPAYKKVRTSAASWPVIPCIEDIWDRMLNRASGMRRLYGRTL